MSGHTKREDLGKLVLRLTLGGLMLFHGVAKLRRGTAGIVRNLQGKGLPGFIAYGVFIGEILAPALIIAGFATRPAAAVMAFNMMMAIYLAHSGDVFHLSRSGGWAIELAMIYLLGSVALVFLGSGRYAVSRGRGRLDA